MKQYFVVFGFNKYFIPYAVPAEKGRIQHIEYGKYDEQQEQNKRRNDRRNNKPRTSFVRSSLFSVNFFEYFFARGLLGGYFRRQIFHHLPPF